MSTLVEPGTVLAGKYRVERTIGVGGMGVVVEATDTRLERRVAIKFLLPDYAEHAEAASRFMREARAAVKIKSDHSARVIDVGTLDSGSPYMVMEYLEGADLAQIIERDGVLSVEDAALYIIQASEAVAEAHSHGIVHRDLKPANLFLAQQPDGSLRIKVLDFGISKVADSQKDQSLTRTSSMMGSPLYMSPEQMRSTRSVDLRTDIWALGVIFYEMVTGSLPFIANSVPELSAKVLLERHEPLNSRRPDLPDALEQIVTKALCKNAADRFPSIAEFAMELLPFAPQRARANVERITKVLQAAGLSTSQFSASTRPPPLTASESSEVSVSMKTLTGHDGESTDGRRSSATLETGSLPGATQVAFGNTAAPRRSGRLGLLAVLVTFVVLLAGGAAYVLTDSKGPSAKQPAGTARQPFAELTPLVKHSPETAPTNSEAAMLAVVDAGKPADDKSEKNLQTVEPKAVKPTAREKPRSAPKPASKKIWSAPTKATLKESESFGEFGGRK